MTTQSETRSDEPQIPNRKGSLENPSARRRLRETMTAVRLSFTWFGTKKTLTPEQRSVAARSVGAESDCLSACKRLFDTRHPRYRAVTAIRSQAAQFWKSLSLPFPEPGIRLIRQPDLPLVDNKFTQFRDDLLSSVTDLEVEFQDLKAAARSQLGDLYEEADYPHSLSGLFDMSWEFPSIEPPPYLLKLCPELYARECQRVQGQFDEAIALAEQAFIQELSRLVEHLSERLAGNADGSPKVFRDSAIENLRDFFTRFRNLNIRSNEQLDELVLRVHQAVQGVAPQQLRDNQSIRQRVATQLSVVQSTLDGLMVGRPRRNILRAPR